MTQSYVARAIADACVAQDGLLVVQLPSELPGDVAEDLVSAANHLEPSDPPYAILISDSDDFSDQWIPRISRTNAIQYRKGDRLAVVPGGGVDLASFDGSYRQALSPGFPAQQSRLLTMEMLSNSLLGLVEAELSNSIDASVWQECVEALALALTTVGEVYEISPDITESWNALWYQHVDSGIRALVDRLLDAERQAGNDSFVEYFRTTLWSSLGLPQPESNRTWEQNNAAKQFVQALDAWWGDGPQIEVTLAHVKPVETRASWEFDWETFDQNRMAFRSSFRALQEMVIAREAGNDWRLMTRTLFENPVTNHDPLSVAGLSGAPLEIGEPGSPALLRVYDDGAWSTSEFVVAVSVQGEIPDDISGIEITSAPSTSRFHAAEKWAEDHRILIRGHVEVRRRSSRAPLRVTLGVDVSAVPDLLGRVNSGAQAKLTLLPSEAGLLVYPINRSGLGAGKYSGPSKDAEEELYFTRDLDRNKSHRVVVWGGEARSEELKFTASDGEPELAFAECGAGVSATISLGDLTFQLVSPEGDPLYETPLAAAPLSEPYSRGPAPAAAQSMIRGIYEQHLLDTDPAGILPSIGHCVMPADGQSDSDRTLSIPPGTSVTTPTGFHTKWFHETLHDVDRPLKQSPEFERFAEAAGDLLAVLHEKGAWPSKTPWRGLLDADSQLLDAYLDAYSELVEEAARHSYFSRFWASFPFSISVWAGARCTAVLLSPLHPIRLAWLAAAERTLEDASTEATGLAGVVEGWAFPLLGPHPTPNGRVVAIPSDSGPGGIFAAWSIMVPLSVNEGRPLQSPQRILGQPAPGASPSGLTASAAQAALRDFERSHPHVPSLTIDLAASEDSPRLEEVDAAVLATIGSWSVDGLRGVRVMDSLHRSGDLPRTELTDLLEGKNAVVTWSRYRPQVGRTQRSNIRLLQDSGAQLRATKKELTGHQVSGRLPLRRFWNTEMVSQNEAFSSTTLGATGWLAFDRAIESVESTPDRSDLGIKLTNSYLVDSGADWTVSGEAFLSPGALGSLLGRQTPSNMPKRMLWEWRPPYLQGSHGGHIERRPYVTTARVSQALEHNLRDKLSLITEAPGDELGDLVRRVLDRLGTRGLGLSSLFTRGDTHESGALGFYLAYELLDRVAPKDAIDVVLPLDACDTFLEAMGGLRAGNASRRADLLLARIRPGEVTLCPIEIKFYGAGTPSGAPLPHPGGALSEAYRQAATTASSLEQALELRKSSDGTADAILWDTAFATLMESGLRLQEDRPDNEMLSSSQVLESIVNGETAVSVGRPVILFFQHGDDSGEQYRARTNVEGGKDGFYGCLIARPGSTFRLLQSERPGNGLLTDWAKVLAWATDTSPEVEVRDGVVPESADEDEPRSSGEVPDVEKGGQSDVGDDGPSAEPEPDVSVEAPDPATPSATADGFELDGIVGHGIRYDLGSYPAGIGQGRPQFWPSNTRLNQMNIGVAGDLGTGKTQLLKALVHQLRESAAATQPNPLSFLILDYKRDFQEPEFLEAVGGKVLSPYDLPLNPLAIRGEYTQRAAYKAAVDFYDVLQRIYSGVGPVQKQRLVDVILDLYKEQGGKPPVLEQVYERYREGGSADSVTSILSDFVLQKVFTDDPSKTQTLDELLHDSVVVVAINEFGTDQDGKNSLVALLLNEYYGFMTRQRKWGYEGSDPQLRRLNSFLLVDEAVNILRYDFEVLMNLLLQGREFGVGVILSSQFLNHFRPKKIDWSEPLLTWFVHKVPSVTQKDLERVGIKVDSYLANAVTSLEVHHALYKGLDEPGRLIRGKPFYELMQERDGAGSGERP